MRNIILSKLKQEIEVPEVNGTLFVHKTFKMHRCVLLANPEQEINRTAEEIRAIVLSYQKSSFFRGMGFGVILKVASIAAVQEEFQSSINTATKSQGIWQWTILHSSKDRQAIGFHTWTEGFISDIFRSILIQFSSDGYRVSDHKAEMAGFFKFMTKWTPQGRLIPQYQEIFPEEDHRWGG